MVGVVHALIMIAVAIMHEYLQEIIPWLGFNIDDIISNIFGVILGIIMGTLLLRITR